MHYNGVFYYEHLKEIGSYILRYPNCSGVFGSCQRFVLIQFKYRNLHGSYQSDDFLLISCVLLPLSPPIE